ncbi:aminotransferase [Protomyces lactucae-debilis]|uniref:Aminotransferase n=1 Tax=Protomyces lactucae-debilis TaxID=2754530 RepID=A0A1Y2FSG3_PROLT|nr:aminotransferase [Protomyces lactucae-debilis]ORY86244.1 aminotransferase [Protomyces lactucae-debilis]
MSEGDEKSLPKECKLLSSILYTSCSFFLADLHYDRLVASSKSFAWPTPQRQDFDRALYQAISTRAHLTLRIRLLCGSDGLFSAEAFSWETVTTDSSWTVLLDVRPVDADLRLVQHKTTLREHYEEPVKRLGTSYTAHQEVLLYNKQGLITEGTISSIAVRRQGKWITPRVESGCLAGVMRRCLLNQDMITEGDIHKDELQNGESVIIFNALRGVLDATLDQGTQKKSVSKS